MDQFEHERQLVKVHVLANVNTLIFNLLEIDSDYLDKCFERHGEIYDEENDEYKEIFEYWIVTSYLGKELADHGEIVWDMNDGNYLWGRTCTGQAIFIDGVIQQISESIMKKIGVG